VVTNDQEVVAVVVQDVTVVRVVTDEENRTVRRRKVVPLEPMSLNSVVDLDVVVVLPPHYLKKLQRSGCCMYVVNPG
jgi:hypothetical protein